MRNQHHLTRGRKPYQYYYFRCIIPKDLRGILGKSQIRISLKNTDYCYSKMIANSLYILAQGIFSDCREGDMKEITLEAVKEILRIEVKKSLLHTHHYEYGTNVYSHEKLHESKSRIDENEDRLRHNLEHDYKGTIELIEHEIDKILISQNLNPNKNNVEYKGLVRKWIDLKLIRQNWKRDLLGDSGKTDDDFKNELEDKWKLGLWNDDETPPDKPFQTEEEINSKLQVSDTGAVGKSNSPLFSKVYPNHLELMARNKRREQTIGETEQTYLDVIELLGDKPIGEYTNLDGRTFRTSIISIPKNRKKMKQYRDKTLHELLEMDVPEIDRLSNDTQTKLISRMTALFNFLIDEYPEYVTENVFKKKSVTVTSRKAKDKRESFTDEDIKSIFHHRNYLPSIFDTHGQSTIKYPYYWIPIMAVLMGARLGEICMMRTKDLMKASGVWVYRIREEGEYGEEETRVKNPYSERDIPIHPELENLGFIRYVKHMKKLGHQRVFHELKMSRGKYSRNVGKWFNQKYLVQLGLKKRGKSFHSIRHSVETHLTNANVNGRYIDFLQGHSQKGIGGNVYMKGIRIDVYSGPHK